MSAVGEEAARRVEENSSWYHTIEVAPGVVTPGYVDLRETANKILPERLDGQRVLDVGTFDGFWAFEHEKRGAEVVAIDVEQIEDADWPKVHRARLLADAQKLDVELGRGFKIAHEMLGSNVRRIVRNVKEVEPEDIGGPVDRAFMGALMLHLRDPVRALEQIHGCLKPGGVLLSMEPFDLKLSIMHRKLAVARHHVMRSDFNHWIANLACLRSWGLSAGFQNVVRKSFERPPQQAGMKGQRYVVLEMHKAR